jgi:peroxiredoxin
MSEQDRHVQLWSLIIVLAVLLAGIAGCRKKRTKIKPPTIEPSTIIHNPVANVSQSDPVQPTGNLTNPGHNTEKPGEVPKTNEAPTPKKTIKELVDGAIYWGQAFESLSGTTAPDFTLKDTEGTMHKLSDYRGKNVMLIFWATWCGPCRIEMPHLIALRNRFSPEKLAMLAIASENPNVDDPPLVRRVAKDINYTVLLEKDNMPKPFGVMDVYTNVGIPCSFFIDPKGKIKLATVGALTLGDMRAIIEAE